MCDELKKCPYCAEMINKDAIKCKECGEIIDSESQTDSKANNLLRLIDKKVTSRKSRWEILPGILTVISTLILGAIGLMFSKQDQAFKKHEVDIKLITDSINTKLRETEIIGTFAPLMADTTIKSIKSKIAFGAMYALDPSLALKLDSIVNTKGAYIVLSGIQQTANNTTDKRKSTSPVEAVLFNTQAQNALTKSNIVLKRALDAYNSTINTTTTGSTYFKIGIQNTSRSFGWNAAFALWCYGYDDILINKLKYIDASSNTNLYDSLLSQYPNCFFSYQDKTKFRKDIPAPGDIVFLDFADGYAEQCGIVYNKDKNFVYTIEGDLDGRVQKKVRDLTDVLVYVRIQ